MGDSELGVRLLDIVHIGKSSYRKVTRKDIPSCGFSDPLSYLSKPNELSMV